jgi:hypothetical protein
LYRVPSVLEGSSKVGAAVCDCEYLPVQISRDQDSEAINLHRHKVASSDVIGLQHGHPLLLLIGDAETHNGTTKLSSDTDVEDARLRDRTFLGTAFAPICSCVRENALVAAGAAVIA